MAVNVLIPYQCIFMHRQINRSKYVDFLGLSHVKGKYCNNIHALLESVDGGTTHISNVGKYLPISTA